MITKHGVVVLKTYIAFVVRFDPIANLVILLFSAQTGETDSRPTRAYYIHARLYKNEATLSTVFQSRYCTILHKLP